VELAVACAVFTTLAACMTLAASSSLKRFGDPYSDYGVERDVKAAVSWMRGHLYRARIFREDVSFFIPLDAYSHEIGLYRKTKSGLTRSGAWSAEGISFRVVKSSSHPGVSFYKYEYSHQTMSPAVTLRVFRRKGDAFEMTEWVITVSAYGMVRLSNG
jgi:hypothetical protein